MQTVTLIYLLYAIRNVKDELNLKTELIYVIIIWVIFSLSYFTALFISGASDAQGNASDAQGNASGVTIFSFI